MTSYFVKLLSSLPPEKISTTTEKIVKNLAVNPLKVESLLGKGEGGVVKASSLAKAVKIAYVFRKAGVLVEVVSQEKPMPSITLTSVPVTVQKSVPLPPLYQTSGFLSNKVQRPFWRSIPGFRSGTTLSGNVLTLLVYLLLIVPLLASSMGFPTKPISKEAVSEKVFASSNIQLRTVATPVDRPAMLELPQLSALKSPDAKGISSAQAIHELEDFFHIETSDLRDGTPRLLGTGNNSVSFFELIGDQENLKTATMFIEASTDNRELNTQNFLLMLLFTKNLTPEWQEGQQWLTDSIPQLLTAPENKISTVVGSKVIDLTAIPETAIVSLSFSFLQ